MVLFWINWGLNWDSNYLIVTLSNPYRVKQSKFPRGQVQVLLGPLEKHDTNSRVGIFLHLTKFGS